VLAAQAHGVAALAQEALDDARVLQRRRLQELERHHLAELEVARATTTPMPPTAEHLSTRY
jgi:hypothetical protein